MRDLNIDVICANTPAAKGRVERAHQTLQDRLVKELRLRGISDQDAGNAYLDEFREDYNRRFARPAKNPRDAHRPLLPSDDLRRSLTWQEQRRLTNNLTLHYKRVLYVIDPTPAADRARGHRVDIRENEDGSLQIEYLGTELPAYAFAKDAHVNPGAIVENKLLGHTLRLIADAQRERDESRLENQRMTLRDQDKLRRAMAAGFDGASHEPKYRVNKPPTYSAMRLAVTVPTDEIESRPSVEALELEAPSRGKPRRRKAPFIGPKRPVGRPPKPKPITPNLPLKNRDHGEMDLKYVDLPPIATADPNPLARVLAWAKSQRSD